MHWKKWKPDIDDDQINLAEARKLMPVGTLKAPFAVWLVENPASPVSLPGSATMEEHDFLHVLLARALHLEDEAFVIGFSMGNVRKTRDWHVKVFKFVSTRLYPVLYRLNYQHLAHFDLGFRFGRSLRRRDIGKQDFSSFADWPIWEIRGLLGIKKDDLRRVNAIGNMEAA